MKLILASLEFFFLFLFSNFNCAHIRDSYRVLGIKHSLSHTHPNRSVRAIYSHHYFIYILTASLVRVIDRPKKGHHSPNMGYSMHKAQVQT